VISERDLHDRVAEWGLRDDVVEKDYVLGWILAGIGTEPVRFAGANRLCIDLGYGGTVRRVEPYSLRVTRDGNLLLYAIRRDNRQLRSYRVDRIQSIEITTEPFRPVHYMEFHPAGPLSAPPTAHRSPVWTMSDNS
jgi:hypothetical protein